MYIETVPNRRSRPAVLLREGWREGSKVRKRTLANLTDWPLAKVEALRRVLKDEPLASADEAIEIERSWPHGHVHAVLRCLQRLKLDALLAGKRCRERDLVVAMLVERVVHPCSKLATTRLWHSTTLAQELDVADASEDELYRAMDWLLERQQRIEKKLSARHLEQGSQVLYDVSSSYFEGHSCPLVRYGHSRDAKRGKPIIVYGMMTDVAGRPIAIQVYAGNTGDPTTVADQVKTLRERFGLERVTLVGDRGMLTQTQVEHLQRHPGLGWISALRSSAIRNLVDSGALQLSLFDEHNLGELNSADFPGERLVACFNPLLAEERRRKRLELLEATEQALEKVVRAVERRTRTPLSEADIGQRVGKVVNQFKMAKHFEIQITAGHLSWTKCEATIATEAALDGIYVIRTSEPSERLSTDDVVRSYKNLAQVERAWRCMKTVDLKVRPIHHRTESRVRAHVFLCMLAYYVEWHMRKALAPMLFDDEQLTELRRTRDPVSPAQPSQHARRKKHRRPEVDDTARVIHSFQTLIAELATQCRHRCRVGAAQTTPAFHKLTRPTALQERAFKLLETFPVTLTPSR